MNASLNYHKWVEWSDEDSCFVAYCPDLFRGGVCHGDDETEVYGRLVDRVNEEIDDLKNEGNPFPEPKIHPSHELAHV